MGNSKKIIEKFVLFSMREKAFASLKGHLFSTTALPWHGQLNMASGDAAKNVCE
jgi:hypothetical protein